IFHRNLLRYQIDRDRGNHRAWQTAAANLCLTFVNRTDQGQIANLREQCFRAAAQLVASDFEHCKRRQFPALIREVEINCRLQRGQNEFVAAKRAEKRLTLERREVTPFSSDDPGLRTTQQFVAAEANE